jgi:hypothetical protein
MEAHMEFKFSGYKVWKDIKDGFGFFDFDILPCVTVHYDSTFEELKTEIKLSWLIWQLRIYF